LIGGFPAMKLIPNLKEIDRKAVLAGISAEALMNNAGRAVAEAILRHGGKRTQGVILCGPGNNGGDGFVCARYLHQEGITKITVVYTGTAYKNEALRHFERLMLLPVEVVNAAQQTAIAMARIRQADFIVDALFGSGLGRDLQGLERQLVEAVNDHRRHSGCLVWAVDLPSGVDGATGQTLGVAVEADETTTFAAAKPGLYLQPGKAAAGEVHIADIGIPSRLLEEDESPFRLITRELAKSWLPERRPDSHKYNYGHVLIIAGSRRMPGAAVLSAEAAVNSGAGLVTLAAPEAVFQQTMLIPEVMRLPLPQTEYLTEEALVQYVLPALEEGRFNTVVLGPGLGQERQTADAILRLLAFLKAGTLSVIVDADALNAVSKAKIQFSDRFILTPHIGEAARLLGVEKQSILANLPESARLLRKQYKAQIVLKSASTVVADDQDLLWISPTGNPGMATAGSGDVLSGFLAAQVAQAHAQAKPLGKAALLAVYLHGLAGDEAASNVTQYAMRASDITYHLPDAFRKLLNCKSDGDIEAAWP
jgi:hydroxyethylthiazole kinase-like uncharacterized protein yjeF